MTVKIMNQFIIKAVLKIVQEYLMLNTTSHLSVDSDEIFVLLTSSEENLKVAADLADYYLQLKPLSEGDESYKEVSPYGTYEKKKKSAHGLM